MSIAQIELMTTDVPVVNTGTGESEKKSPRRESLEEAARKWKEKYGDGGKKPDLSTAMKNMHVSKVEY